MKQTIYQVRAIESDGGGKDDEHEIVEIDIKGNVLNDRICKFSNAYMADHVAHLMMLYPPDDE